MKSILSFALGAAMLAAAAPAFSDVRAIWVTRWDFKTAQDIEAILNNCKELHATDVFFQVRGNATAYYPSAIEPWAWELTGESPLSTGRDPGWDPLKTALDDAEALGLRLHAWVNAFPGWRGTLAPPRSSGQVWAAKRQWFMVDHKGDFMWPPKSWYAFLSPGIPEAQQHIISVMEELAKKYPRLAGVHLDYIRYPGNTELGSYRNFSFDPVSVKRFQQEYGSKPRHDSLEWSRFKQDRISETIRGIRDSIKDANPGILLTATFFANIDKATGEKGQDPRVWLNEPLVDWAIPMVYQRTQTKFDESLDELAAYVGVKHNDRMVPGLLATSNSAAVTEAQIETLRERGFLGSTLFAYSALYRNHKPNSKAERISRIWHEYAVQSLLKGPLSESGSPGGPLNSQ